MATTPIQYPYVNGVRQSFASIEFRMNGQIFVGFKSIDYNRTRDREEVRGNSPDPLGKTIGENKYTASCDLYLAEWNLFQSQLGPGYGDILFPCYVTYSSNGFDTIQDIIIGCTVDTTESTNQQGPAGTTRKIDLKPLKILFNGVDDLLVPLVGVP
jgi:hypothetical protein